MGYRPETRRYPEKSPLQGSQADLKSSPNPFKFQMIAPLLWCFLSLTPSSPQGPDEVWIQRAHELSQRTLVLKLDDGLQAWAESGRLFGPSDEVRGLSDQLQEHEVQPLFQQSALELLEFRNQALARGHWPLPPDLSLYFKIECQDSATAASLVDQLQDHPVVAHAYMAPAPAPPPADIPPTTPHWTDQQDYFESPTDGTRMFEVAGVLGARGRNVRMTDCEYAWVYDHEDLELDSSHWVGGTPVGIWEDHGTAVLGQIYAQDNGYGVTGGVPNCDPYMATEYAVSWGFNPTQAIINAAAASQAGDVILLEMQTGGPTGAYVPEEWTQASFDAILNATAAGIHVVEAGGNGGMDLDDAVFGGKFDVTVRDSGAVIVGASQSWNPQVKQSWTSRGSRVDCQGWGDSIYTTGYGDLWNVSGDDRQDYTWSFGGTSGASPIVTSAVVSVIGAMKAHGMSLPSPTDLRAALRVTGTPQPAWDEATGRIGPQPDMEALFDWFQLPEGMRHPGAASLGDSLTVDLQGNPNENWTLYRAMNTAITNTSAGTRVLGNQQFAAVASGVLDASGNGSFTGVIPNKPALVGREVFTQTYFDPTGTPRWSNGGAILIQ
ncbi:MAG: hypothetical protein DWQ01_22000 [Planctomycetota bacterium]|nr:MAG: hypothetical protein DWQ01_22000 [Planctomycetota bacterium]